MTQKEVEQEAARLRETLTQGLPARLSNGFLQSCDFNDYLCLLELLPFPLTLNMPHCRGEPMFLSRADRNHQSVRGLYARCFGNFELYCDGRPVTFGRQQTKELVAILIDRKGAILTAEEIAATIWGDFIENSAAIKHRIRNLVGDLTKTFSALGFAEIVHRSRNQIGLRTDWLECDYFRYLSGTARPQEQFRGEYMEQYSWAEVTKGALIFNIK